MEELGGFLLLSITEDIHTSQHLHAKGWRSVFVDKDLAVGLTAENLAGYLVQRRRWMLGCLQIFFRDNPLVCRGLPLRHRLGYFASLYYFFFPLARVVFWVTPLYFLLFHLHPLFTEASVLLAFLLPYLVVLPLITRVCLPGWPRFLWGTLYETVVSFALVRSILDLVLPKKLGFKVTPKGVLFDRRRFDFSSGRLTLAAAVLTFVAVAKGIFEFAYFGIERDAYFINLLWATSNLIELAVALLVAWERPQRRAEERLTRPLRIGVRGGAEYFETVATDVSLSGLSFPGNAAQAPPREAEITFVEASLTLDGRLVYADRGRVAFEFIQMDQSARRTLVRLLFTDPTAWERAHEARTRSAAVIGTSFAIGIAKSFLPMRARRRLVERRPALKFLRCVSRGQGRTLWLRERTDRGLGLLLAGWPLEIGDRIPILMPRQPVQWARVVHQSRKLPGIWKLGVELLPEAAEERADAYLAA